MPAKRNCKRKKPIPPAAAAKATEEQAVVSNTRPFPTGWVLLFLGGLSVCIQYVTVEKFSVFPLGGSHVTWENFIRSVEAQITFSALDGLLVALFLVGSAFVLYQEMRFRVLSDFLQDCFASQRKTLGLLIGCLLVGVRFYLARGEVSWRCWRV